MEEIKNQNETILDSKIVICPVCNDEVIMTKRMIKKHYKLEKREKRDYIIECRGSGRFMI